MIIAPEAPMNAYLVNIAIAYNIGRKMIWKKAEQKILIDNRFEVEDISLSKSGIEFPIWTNLNKCIDLLPGYYRK